MTDSITVCGYVATDMRRIDKDSGMTVTSFRLASSQGHRDPATSAWVEEPTNWYTVSAFRELARHIATSLHKGDPVIVQGKLRLREFRREDGSAGLEADIAAFSVGHDLRRGIATFAKQVRPAAPAQPQAAGQAGPAPRGVDASTGELDESYEGEEDASSPDGPEDHGEPDGGLGSDRAA